MRFALILALLVSGAAAQEAALPPPQIGRCDTSEHPLLPGKWRATYLMAPFGREQLVLGEIERDHSLAAMRVRLHGVQRGAVDLLVVGRNTYELVSEGSAVRSCRDLGDTGWRPLPRSWLQPRSQCVGSAPIGGTAVDWWKTPIKPAPASYWLWTNTADRTPFRLVFSSASDRLPPLSRYALSYQVAFEPDADLAGVVAPCHRVKTTANARGPRAIRALLDAMAQAEPHPDGRIQQVMPALDAQCQGVSLPQWPERLAMTGLMTPFDSDEDPYPAEVLYDWSVPGQRTRIFDRSAPARADQDFLLLDPHGYTITYRRQQPLTCKPVLPGAIRPDWTARGPCACAAAIRGTTPLSPHGTTVIMSCPLASPRVAWAWYATTGRPTTFMVTSRPGDEGKGLFAVLDYLEWLPNHAVARSVFDKPASCGVAQSQPAGPPPAKRCSTCHLGPAATGR